MKPKSSGIWFAVISPFLSSIATVLSATATKLLAPIFVSGIGGIIGSLILFSSMLISKEKIDLHKIKRNFKDLLKMILIRGVFGSAFLSIGLYLTDGIRAILFTKMEPYFVLGWHWLLLREKIQKRHLILLTTHIIGAIILSTGGSFVSFGRSQLGDLFVILAMVLFALSYIYGRKLSQNLGARTPTMITTGIGGLILLPISLFFISSHVWDVTSVGWLYLISSTILFNVFGLTFWFASLKTVKGWMVSAFRSLGPIAGMPFAYFFFGETLSLIQITGGVIVLITSALIAREHLRSENSKLK